MSSVKLTKQQIQLARKFVDYQKDPCGFFVDVLGLRKEYIWYKFREVAESVRDNWFTAVPAGHSVSKTYGAARIVVWFKSCFQPSTVITTAPSDNQVRNQLWREIRGAYHGSKVPLGGKITTLQWDNRPSSGVMSKIPREDREDWERNFAIGFSTSPDSVGDYATKMQGWHNKWMLIVLDEAAGIMPQIWSTVLRALAINPRCKVLAIGNPTDPYSKFAEVCKSARWNTIKVSIRDTPNYIEGKEVVPNLAGRDFEQQIIDECGENSNEHKVRCLGEFPLYMEGTVYGPEIGEIEQNKHFGDYPYDNRLPVYTIGDYGSIYTAVGFFQVKRDTLRLIDYFYDDVGIGVPGLCKMFDSKPYVYAKRQGHWISPDYDPQHGSNRKSLGTGNSVLADFARLGYHMDVCQPHSFDAGVKTVRTTLPLMRIDGRCADFWDSIKAYKFKKLNMYSTDEKPAYSKDPEKGPASHPADMLRYLCWVYRFQLDIDGVRVGSPVPIPVSVQHHTLRPRRILDYGRRRKRV